VTHKPQVIGGLYIANHEAARCPECDALLVVRTNSRTGGQFLGCDNFPRCKYTLSGVAGLAYKKYDDGDYLRRGRQAVATQRVSQAVRNGTIQKTDTCASCGATCEPVAHHYAGYDHPFDIWWVCRTCNAYLPHNNELTLEQAKIFMSGIYADKARLELVTQGWEKGFCHVCGQANPFKSMRSIYNGKHDAMALCLQCDAVFSN